MFLETVKQVEKHDVRKCANIVSSHTIYKLKQSNDGYFKLKYQIDTNGNEEYMKCERNKEC